jgi:hypothetical protein
MRVSLKPTAGWLNYPLLQRICVQRCPDRTAGGLDNAPDVIGRLAGLVGAEQQCCTFYTFTINKYPS